MAQRVCSISILFTSPLSMITHVPMVSLNPLSSQHPMHRFDDTTIQREETVDAGPIKLHRFSPYVNNGG